MQTHETSLDWVFIGGLTLNDRLPCHNDWPSNQRFPLVLAALVSWRSRGSSDAPPPRVVSAGSYRIAAAAAGPFPPAGRPAPIPCLSDPHTDDRPPYSLRGSICDLAGPPRSASSRVSAKSR
jgi:hypothetical protein